MTKEYPTKPAVCYRHPNSSTCLRCNKCNCHICSKCAKCMRSHQDKFFARGSCDYFALPLSLLAAFFLPLSLGAWAGFLGLSLSRRLQW
jgi:hypothetical protein